MERTTLITINHKWFLYLSVFSYCMAGKVKREVPEDWVCESCRSVCDSVLMESGKKDEAVTRAMSKGESLVSQLHSKKQKPVETGKVQFIPHEEIIKLSSGSFNESKGQKLNFAC